MNRSGLINKIGANASPSTKLVVRAMVEATLRTISEALRDGEKVDLLGFGSFSVKETPARTGRNPRTGEEIEIPAGKKVKFKPSRTLLA